MVCIHMLVGCIYSKQVMNKALDLVKSSDKLLIASGVYCKQQRKNVVETKRTTNRDSQISLILI